MAEGGGRWRWGRGGARGLGGRGGQPAAGRWCRSVSLHSAAQRETVPSCARGRGGKAKGQEVEMGEPVSMETGIQWTAAHAHAAQHWADLAKPQVPGPGPAGAGAAPPLPVLRPAPHHPPAPRSGPQDTSALSSRHSRHFQPWPESRWPSLALTLDRHSPAAPGLGTSVDPGAGAAWRDSEVELGSHSCCKTREQPWAPPAAQGCF